MVVGAGLGPDRDAAESPPVDLPNEAGVLGLVEVAGQDRLGELVHVEDLPAAAVGKPGDDVVQLGVGQDVEQRRGEGRLVARAGLAGVAAAAALGVQTPAGPIERLVDVLLGGVIGDARAVHIFGMNKADLDGTTGADTCADSIGAGGEGRQVKICVVHGRKKRRRRGGALAVVIHALHTAAVIITSDTPRSGQEGKAHVRSEGIGSAGVSQPRLGVDAAGGVSHHACRVALIILVSKMVHQYICKKILFVWPRGTKTDVAVEVLCVDRKKFQAVPPFDSICVFKQMATWQKVTLKGKIRKMLSHLFTK